MSDKLKAIVDAVKERAPGPGNLWFTVSRLMLADIQWNNLVDPPIEKFIANECEAKLDYDSFGNPVFQLLADSCRARTRREIQTILGYELRMVGFFEQQEDRVFEVLDKIMAVFEKEGK